MKKFLLSSVVFLLLTVCAFGQKKFSLLPTNIINYVGKVDRVSFEDVVGPPVGLEEGFIVYEVENTYDSEVTALRCFYHETTGKLISVRFGTGHYLGYWINFTRIKGFPKTERESVRLGMCKMKVDEFRELYQINLRIKTFGCQIMNITRQSPQLTTAIINYHVVK